MAVIVKRKGRRKVAEYTGAKFLQFEQVKEFFSGKTVAIVGSGPGIMDNAPGHIDSHDIVLRVNNYKLLNEVTGKRTDVYFSFFGNSIKKLPQTLKSDGVKLVMCKCPNGGIDSPWHHQNGRQHGANWEWIYQKRKGYWFCNTYIPTMQAFEWYRRRLSGHIPTTGLSAIMDVIQTDAKHIYITGFDFFSSKIHNVNEKWEEKNNDDPIRHRPDLEEKLLRKLWQSERMSADKTLTGIIR